MKKYLVMLLLYCFVLTGCPAKTIQRAKESSAKVATYANAGVDVTREAYRAQLINLAVKDKIADAFIVLATAGIAFDLAVKNAEEVYGANPPKATIDALFATFNASVVAKFLEVLSAAKLAVNVGSIASTIEAIKTAVLLIAAAFNRAKEVEAKLTI